MCHLHLLLLSRLAILGAKPQRARVVTNGVAADSERAAAVRNDAAAPGPGYYEPQLDAAKPRGPADVALGNPHGPKFSVEDDRQRAAVSAHRRGPKKDPGPATYESRPTAATHPAAGGARWSKAEQASEKGRGRARARQRSRRSRIASHRTARGATRRQSRAARVALFRMVPSFRIAPSFRIVPSLKTLSSFRTAPSLQSSRAGER